MKKRFLAYAFCWFLLLALFNVICFVTPSEIEGYDKFGGAFWAGYVFISIAFVGQLICSYFALKAENLQKLFYNLPLITVSYTGLILTVIFGTVCMAVPNLPNWVGIIVCLLILALNATALIKASAAAEIVSGIDEKVKEKTFFIKNLTIEAESLMNRAKTDESKAACKKVYEALRYADPMSNDAFAGVEGQITLKFNEFSNTVTSDADNLSVLADELVVLIGDRNKKCKVLK